MSLLKTEVYTVFDFVGKNETSLTAGLGVLLKSSPKLVKALLKTTFPDKLKRITPKFMLDYRVSVERDRIAGRTDIEIWNDNFHIIVEGKIGTNYVHYEQARKYSEDLIVEKAVHKGFVFLTEVGNVDIYKKLKDGYPDITFSNITWATIFKLVEQSAPIDVDLSKEFSNYLIRSHDMKIHDIDIWAVVVRGEQEENFDKYNYYINGKKHFPVFIGKRYWDDSLRRSVVTEIRPVTRIYDKDDKKGIENNNCYVYELGPAIKLANPVNKKFSQASAIEVRFEEVAAL